MSMMDQDFRPKIVKIDSNALTKVTIARKATEKKNDINILFCPWFELFMEENSFKIIESARTRMRPNLQTHTTATVLHISFMKNS